MASRTGTLRARPPGLAVLAAALALPGVGACGQSRAPAPTLEPDTLALDPCRLLDASVQSRETINVGLLAGAEPDHAPFPRNADERVVFRQLYETLIQVDCLGRIRPALAEDWHASDGGRRWSLRLREGPRFWDGEPVLAGTVKAAWDREESREAAHLARIDSVVVENDREITVFVEVGRSEPPSILAAPVFAVSQRSPDLAWPMGTGSYRVDESAPGRVVVARAEDGRPTINFVSAVLGDARDLLDGGVDLLVTADPAVIEYAERLSYERITLPWDRSYLLLATSRAQTLRLGGEVGTLPASLLDSMARNAIQGEARAHERSVGPEGFWGLKEACGSVADILAGLPPVPRGAYTIPGRRIVFDAADRVARALAERIVALAAGGPGAEWEAGLLASAIPGLSDASERLVAEGVGGLELETSLRDGDDFAYIVAVPLAPLDPCYERRRLVRRAQWLGAEKLDLSSAVLPLVDTRRQAIARPGSLGLRLQGDGGVSIDTDPMEATRQ